MKVNSFPKFTDGFQEQMFPQDLSFIKGMKRFTQVADKVTGLHCCDMSSSLPLWLQWGHHQCWLSHPFIFFLPRKVETNHGKQGEYSTDSPICCQGHFTLLKIIENPKELLFMWVISIDSSCIID